jgi:sugar O-acyltransferase (sialic acid O-acetyltransferase NeuD family)
MNEVIVWGGTGNYKVVKEIIESNNQKIIALFDNNISLANPYPEIPFIGGQNSFPEWIRHKEAAKINCVVAIGGNYGRERLEIQNFLGQYGVKPLTIQHKTSYISPSAVLGEGTHIYAMASVCVEVVTGKSCIINTSASVDHECILGDGVFIGPGAKLAGSINVGKFADIYTGAIVLPRIKIGEAAVIGAGSVVIEDVPPYTVVAGSPAKILKERKH